MTKPVVGITDKKMNKLLGDVQQHAREQLEERGIDPRGEILLFVSACVDAMVSLRGDLPITEVRETAHHLIDNYFDQAEEFEAEEREGATMQ